MKNSFYAFQWPFLRTFQWGGFENGVTADGLTTWFSLYLSSLLWCLFFPSLSSCKIGVWLNTCKLCCDYQPLKSSFKNKNLYIVKSLRLPVSLFPPYQSWPSTCGFDLVGTVCAECDKWCHTFTLHQQMVHTVSFFFFIFPLMLLIRRRAALIAGLLERRSVRLRLSKTTFHFFIHCFVSFVFLEILSNCTILPFSICRYILWYLIVFLVWGQSGRFWREQNKAQFCLQWKLFWCLLVSRLAVDCANCSGARGQEGGYTVSQHLQTWPTLLNSCSHNNTSLSAE